MLLRTNKCQNTPDPHNPLVIRLVVSSLWDLTCLYSVCMSVLGPARESSLSLSTKKYSCSLCCSLSLAVFRSCLCSVSPSPHHLSVSHHCEGRKPWGASQPDLFNGASGRLYEVCVGACLCTHGRQWISQKGEEQRNESGWRSLIAQHIWRGPGEDAGRLDRVRSRHLARIHNMHTNPHSVPLLVSRVALRFDLDTVG